MSKEGYLQNKIREQNEKILALENKIKSFEIKIETIEHKKEKGELGEISSRIAKLENMDYIKILNHEVNNLSYKIRGIQNQFFEKMIEAYNQQIETLRDGLYTNASGINTLMNILLEKKIINMTMSELNYLTEENKKLLLENQVINKMTIRRKDIGNKILFDILKKKEI